MDKVKFGFFPEFQDPTILFFGSRESLGELQRVLRLLEKNKNLELQNDNGFFPLNGIKLTLSLADSIRGMRVENLAKSAFRWNLSAEDAFRLAEKISFVISSDQPSHDYLDSPSDDVQVIVSQGEYPDTFAP